MFALKNALPETEVLAVTVLTSLSGKSCNEVYGCTPEEGVLRLARLAAHAAVGGLILSPKELVVCKERPGLSLLSLNTPGIRPEWSLVGGDDQERVMTPAKAIQAGADRLVIGRPITGAKPNSDGLPRSPRDAIERTLEEINNACS